MRDRFGGAPQAAAALKIEIKQSISMSDKAGILSETGYGEDTKPRGDGGRNGRDETC